MELDQDDQTTVSCPGNLLILHILESGGGVNMHTTISGNITSKIVMLNNAGIYNFQ